MSSPLTTGVLYLHSASQALCPHIEWAIADVLDVARPKLDWIPQPAEPRSVRTEYSWRAAAGTGAALASHLQGWSGLRFEVTEDPSVGVDGGRWSYTPNLGLWYGQTDTHGNVVVAENRLRAAMVSTSNSATYRNLVDSLLGTPWDAELESYRAARDDAKVTWMHRVG